MENRTAKLVFRTAYLSVGIVGIFASLGFFGYNYREDFYVYFTNLSNYLCFGIMLVKFICTVQDKDTPHATIFHLLDFASVLSILLTFFVFNFILADYYYGSNPAAKYEISSVLYHVVLPLMFATDRMIFRKKSSTYWYFPIVSVLIPIIYGTFIFIRAAIPGIEEYSSVIYPYFFLNISNFGMGNTVKWITVMLLVYVAAGYVLYFAEIMISTLMTAVKKHHSRTNKKIKL